MTKRVFMLMMLAMIMVGSVNAQSINGRWKASEELKKKMDMTGNDPKMDIVLDITSTSIAVEIPMSMKDNEMSANMRYRVPGTYTRTGNKVVAKFNTKKADFEVIDFDTNDTEMKAMMKTAEGKKAMLKLLNETLKEQIKDDLKDINDVTKLFKMFTIQKVTDSALTIKMQDEAEGTFTRTK